MFGATGRRGVTVVTGMTLGVALVAGPASAAENLRGDANGAGIAVRLPGGTLIEGGSGRATVFTGATAAAGGAGFSPDPASTAAVEITSAQATAARDPQASERCAAPLAPGIARGLALGLACSSAAAAITDAATATSNGAGALGGVSTDGSLVGEAIIAPIITPLAEQLDAGLASVGGAVVGDALDQLAAQCAVLINDSPARPADLPPLPTELGQVVPGPLMAFIDGLGADNPCAVYAAMLQDPPVIGQVDPAALAARLADAFAGVALLKIDFGSTDTASTLSGADVVAESAVSGLSVTSPSLGFLLPTIDAVVGEVLAPFVAAVDQTLGPLREQVPAPAAADLLGAVRIGVDIPLLTSPDPLITVTALTSQARATYTGATRQIDLTGTPGQIAVTLSPAFADLFGASNTSYVIGESGSQTIFEGTPLESTFRVGTVAPYEDEIDGVPGRGIRVTGLGIELVKGAEGGLAVTVAEASAAVRAAPVAPAAPVAQAAPGEELPMTGGGQALAGLLALLAGGSLLLLRRR